MKYLFLIFLCTLSTISISQNLPPISCGTVDTLSANMKQLIQFAKENQNSKYLRQTENLRELRIAVVIDSTVYYAYNADTNLIKEMLFKTIGEVSAIYERELNFRINITYIEFSLTNRKYNSLDGSFSVIHKFSNDYATRTEINRDIMMLWSIYASEPYGGVTNSIGLIGLNSATHIVSSKYLGLSSGVIAHEFGHLIGSPHTQSCYWPNGPFEVCSDVEWGCSPIPINVKWGSIMSYCSQGELSFHPLCIDIIQKSSYPKISVMKEIPKNISKLYYPGDKIENFHPKDFFAWQAVENITGYQVQLSKDIKFSELILDTLVSYNTFFMNRNLLKNTVYYWRVRAINQVGNGEWSNFNTFTSHNDNLLKIPRLNQIDKTRTMGDQILSFNPVDNAENYTIQFLINETNKLVVEKIVQGTSFRAGDFVMNNEFAWRVRANNATSSSDWSEKQTFYLSEKATLIVNDTLQPIGTNVATSAYFNISTRDLKRTIKLEASESADFNKPILKKQIYVDYNNKSPFSESKLAVCIDSLEANKKYYYRLKMLSASDSTDWISSNFSTSNEMRWKSICGQQNPLLSQTAIWDGVFVDKSNNRWLYGNEGVFVISENGDVQNFNTENTKNKLANLVSIIKQDSSNKMWFGTVDGISTYDNGTWQYYSSKLWAKNGSTYDNDIKDIVFSNKKVMYCSTSTGRIISFDGVNWKDITVEENPIGRNYYWHYLLSTDQNGNLWYITNLNGNVQIKIYNGNSWSNFNPSWYFLDRPKNIMLDNMDNLYFLTGDSLFAVNKNELNYKSTNIRYIEAIDQASGAVKILNNNTYIGHIRKMKNSIYWSLGDKFLEFDGNKWWYYYQPNLLFMNNDFNVDNNGNILGIKYYKSLIEFDRKNIIKNFNQKTVGIGCKISFNIGVAIPPVGTAAEINLKVYLSDSSSNTFTLIPVNYQNGQVDLYLPKQIQGKGYRFKYTVGEWLESKESQTFDIGNAFTNLAITGSNEFCSGSKTELEAIVVGGKEPYSYEWNPGGGSQKTFVVSSGNSYSLKVTDVNGCSQTSMGFKVVEKGPKEAKISVTYKNPVIHEPYSVILNANTIDSVNYQWLLDNKEILNANKANFVVIESGNYGLKLTKDGCTLLSDNIVISVEKLLANQNDMPNELLIYVAPNPTITNSVINFYQPNNSILTIDLYNQNGQKISTLLRDNFDKGWYNLNLDVKKLNSGVYFCKIFNNETYKSIKILVVK